MLTDKAFDNLEVTRIDFDVTSSGVVVNKIAHISDVHGDRDIVVKHETKPGDFDVEWALAWCERHGWTVRRWRSGEKWNAGARAWKGEKFPVRTPGQIRKKRKGLGVFGLDIDLAFDL